MNKSELIQILKKACEAEEKAVPIYARHLEAAIFWTGISEARADEAKEILRCLARESAAHKVIVERLIKGLEKE